MVGHRCKSKFKDIEGNIINQGDYVLYKDYDRIIKGTVLKIGNTVIIKGDNNWTRLMHHMLTEKQVFILKKNKD